MKFLADENFDKPVIQALRERGFDVFSISEELSQSNDDTVLKKANNDGRLLLTCDKDFGELVFRLKLISSGIILLRTPELNNAEKATLLMKCIEAHQAELFSSFTVITTKKIRIVKLQNR